MHRYVLHHTLHRMIRSAHNSIQRPRTGVKRMGDGFEDRGTERCEKHGRVQCKYRNLWVSLRGGRVSTQ